MAAAFVLIVGLLGVLGMLTRAMSTTSSSNQRVAATNVTRELVESARGITYETATPAGIEAAIKAKGIGSGTPWTVVRRGVTYTITASVCTLDSPADGIETTAPANLCTPALTSTRTDLNGDDFRRVTFVVSWREGSTVQVGDADRADRQPHRRPRPAHQDGVAAVADDHQPHGDDRDA